MFLTDPVPPYKAHRSLAPVAAPEDTLEHPRFDNELPLMVRTRR